MPLRSPLDRPILRFAIPALATMAVDPLVSMVDTAFVGRLGTGALAALGVNVGIFGLAFYVFNFLANGTTPLVAGALGEGDRDRAGRVVVAGLGLATALGVLGTVILLSFDVTFARWMGVEDAFLPETLAYLRARAWAAPAVLLVTAGHGAYRGHQDTTTPLWIALVVNAVNLALDPLLMFGLGWGVAGAAWATVAAQWTGAVGFLVLLYGRDRERFGLPLELPRPAYVSELLGVGSALAVRTFALVFTFTAATSVATRLGATVVAAHQVAWQLFLMLAMFVDSFAFAAQSLVADRAGSGAPREARAMADRLLQWGFAVGCGQGLVLWALNPLWPGLFDLEPAVAAELATVMAIVAGMQPLAAMVFVGDGIFMGARRFGALAGAMLFATVPTLWALRWTADHGGGLRAVWWCVLGLIALRAVSLSSLYFGRWSILPRT